jgi:hypothetical protein
MGRGRERFLLLGAAGGLASTVLAASVSAQTPVPPSGPAPPVIVEGGGPMKRAFHHTYNVLQDNFIGYPSEFVEPPLGAYVRGTMGVMKVKADPHKFTLYQTDFLAGSNALSPVGAGRFNLMVSRLKCWTGPILIEWSPDQPGLAESRRDAVFSMLQGGGIAVIPEQVVVGPSPFPGLYGNYAAGTITALFTRDISAPSSYSLTPATPTGSYGTGGGSQ